MTGNERRHYWLAAALVAAFPVNAQIAEPATAPARGPDAPQPAEDGVRDRGPIIPDAEFGAALPPLSGDIDAPLPPMPTAGTQLVIALG